MERQGRILRLWEEIIGGREKPGNGTKRQSPHTIPDSGERLKTLFRFTEAFATANALSITVSSLSIDELSCLTTVSAHKPDIRISIVWGSTMVDFKFSQE